MRRNDGVTAVLFVRSVLHKHLGKLLHIYVSPDRHTHTQTHEHTVTRAHKYTNTRTYIHYAHIISRTICNEGIKYCRVRLFVLLCRELIWNKC